VALAAVAESDAQLLSESADLLFHLMVLLRSRNLQLQDVVQVLAARHSGSKSA
jgi:phosphoribosyl-ATP pyrophosphohydrolase/phosphoribosyl-AMP cyclohydrolase